MVEKLIKLTGAAAPILRDNIDTDTVAPMVRLSQIGKPRVLSSSGQDTDLDNLFALMRFDEKNNEVPDFILNQPGFREAKILLAGTNFACGSSRESAVWYLLTFGIRCVIAPSFGEIFFNSAFKNGVLPLAMPMTDVEALAAESGRGAPDAEFTVDLESQEVRTPSGRQLAFSIPEFRRQALMQGLDEIDQNRAKSDLIAAHLGAARQARPWQYLA